MKFKPVSFILFACLITVGCGQLPPIEILRNPQIISKIKTIELKPYAAQGVDYFTLRVDPVNTGVHPGDLADAKACNFAFFRTKDDHVEQLISVILTAVAIGNEVKVEFNGSCGLEGFRVEKG